MNVKIAAIIMKKEMRDARRNRWFVVVSFLFALLSVSFSLFGMAGLGSLGVAGFGRTAASLLNLVLLIVPLLGLLLGSVSIVSEREQGTLMTLLAQPVTPNEIFLGKYLGSAFSIFSTVFLGFGVSAIAIAKYAGTKEIADYLMLVCFTVLLGLAFLSIAFCVSLLVRRHATAMGTAIFIWFFFIFISDLGLMGTSIVLKLTPMALFWLVVLNPAQAFKVAVVGNLQKSFEIFGAAGLYATETLGRWLSPILIVTLCLWIFLPLVLAFFYFRSRCVD